MRADGYVAAEPLLPAEAPLMTDVLRGGGREHNSARTRPLQREASYVMRNKHTVRAGVTGESNIFWAGAGHRDVLESNVGTEVLDMKFVRDGSIRGYILSNATTGQEFLKIHFHGDTTNPFSRATKAFFRSPVLKWDVENRGLFSWLRVGANLGLIREVFPDSRVFEPNAISLPAVPRLEMQTAATLGAKYYLAVTGIPEPVGEVVTSLLGRVANRSEQYTLVLRDCTPEEALLWISMLIATDMKRRKSAVSKGLRPVGTFF